MNSRYNELKLEILEEADTWKAFTAGDMANALERTHCSVAMALLRYHRQGLFSRHTINRNEKVYELTSRGLERLEWLRKQAVNDSDDGDMFDDVEKEDEDENDEDDEQGFESLSEIDKELLFLEQDEDEEEDENDK